MDKKNLTLGKENSQEIFYDKSTIPFIFFLLEVSK